MKFPLKMLRYILFLLFIKVFAQKRNTPLKPDVLGNTICHRYISTLSGKPRDVHVTRYAQKRRTRKWAVVCHNMKGYQKCGVLSSKIKLEGAKTLFYC